MNKNKKVYLCPSCKKPISDCGHPVRLDTADDTDVFQCSCGVYSPKSALIRKFTKYVK